MSFSFPPQGPNDYPGLALTRTASALQLVAFRNLPKSKLARVVAVQQISCVYRFLLACDHWETIQGHLILGNFQSLQRQKQTPGFNNPAAEFLHLLAPYSYFNRVPTAVVAAAAAEVILQEEPPIYRSVQDTNSIADIGDKPVSGFGTYNNYEETPSYLLAPSPPTISMD
jgi:hypothetical protein